MTKAEWIEYNRAEEREAIMKERMRRHQGNTLLFGGRANTDEAVENAKRVLGVI